ncbi:MAG: hypothetical protein D3913_11335, partial [Candidatus Electrothrix sp. LOE1_4_5]|nr:hypothetical protein [Candidatus Electrothrix gigas]
DVGKAITTVTSLGVAFVDLAQDLPKAAEELAVLRQGWTGKRVLKNLLLYGSGRRVGKIQAMLDQVKVDNFFHLLFFISAVGNTIDDIYTSHEKSVKAFEALLYLVQRDVASEQAENLRNGEWAKITLQDFIVKKWKEENKINDSTYDEFNNMNVYSKEKKGFWRRPIVEKIYKAEQYYDLITDDDLSAPEEPLYDFETEIHKTSLNLYDIQVPETILSDAAYGQPQSITFLYNGVNIFTSYPDAVSNRTNISGTEIPKSFTLNLSAYSALKTTKALTVIVDYDNDNRKYASDYLSFSPEITSVTVLSPPNQWISANFFLGVEICGDETSTVYIFYKKAEDNDSYYEYVPFNLPEPTNIDGDCRTYNVTVNGWDIMSSLGGNRDVSLKIKALGTSVAVDDRTSEELTKYLINLDDLDNDTLPDSWEEGFFGDRAAYSGLDDPDGDSIINLFEYRYDTDPTKPGAEGIIESRTFAPIQFSSGDWQYDFTLQGIYWENIVQKNATLKIYEDEVVVQGGYSLEAGTLDLNGCTLVIMGDLIHSGGVLNVNGGKLIVKGDYRIQKENADGSSTYGNGQLKMINKLDHIIVEGNFVMDSSGSHDGKLTAGTLELKGNFIQKSTYTGRYDNFKASGTHKVLLSGSNPQEISFTDASNTYSHFNILEITNPDAKQITFSPYWPALVYSGETLTLGNVTIGAVDFVVPANRTLTIEGNLIHPSGLLNMNRGKLIVKGDYRIQKENADGSYTYSGGFLKMVNETDHVVVEGDFITDSSSSYDGRLTAGTLELKGNFIQKSTYTGRYDNFKASGTHKVLLSGLGAQEISFEDASNSYSHFNILEITNPDPKQITFSPCWPALVYSDAGPPLGDVNIGGVDFVLSKDLTITPSEESVLQLYGAMLDLNGHTLTVEGDLVHSGGLLNVNGGKLIVKGDYRIQKENADGSSTYGNGQLKMINKLDHIIVEGNFVMDSSGSHDGKLTAGTLELKGNFIQKSTYTGRYDNFKASGTHKVLLSSSGPQEVSFEDASSSQSHFNELLLTTNTLKTFTTKVAVTKLFNHQRNPFTLADPDQSYFVDYDGDGIKDHLDSYPLDPTNQGTNDRDNDGVPDDEDAFPDDSTESVDSDSDGIGDNADTDDDNDGIADAEDAFPLDAAEWSDSDNDGQGDNADIDDDND